MTTQIILPSPNSANAAEQAAWTGQAFVLGTATKRILSYPVRESGWNDDIARFHRQEAASDHFIDIASRAHAMKEVKRSIVQTPSVILEILRRGFFCASSFSNCPGMSSSVPITLSIPCRKRVRTYCLSHYFDSI